MNTRALVYGNHLTAEVRRILTMARRYPVQTFSGMLTMVAVFIMLMAGSHYLAGGLTTAPGRQGAIAIGLVLWNLLLLSLGEISVGIQAESQIGTLEHLFLASQSLLRVMIIRAAVSECLFVVVNCIILALILMATHITISFSPIAIIPLLAALLAANGIGLALGAMAIVWKRVGSVLQLVQFFIASIVVPPFEQLIPGQFLPYTSLLPLAPAARALRTCLIQGSALSGSQVAGLLLNGLTYFLIGIVVFRFGERFARKAGSLATY